MSSKNFSLILILVLLTGVHTAESSPLLNPFDEPKIFDTVYINSANPEDAYSAALWAKLEGYDFTLIRQDGQKITENRTMLINGRMPYVVFSPANVTVVNRTGLDWANTIARSKGKEARFALITKPEQAIIIAPYLVKNKEFLIFVNETNAGQVSILLNETGAQAMLFGFAPNSISEQLPNITRLKLNSSALNEYVLKNITTGDKPSFYLSINEFHPDMFNMPVIRAKYIYTKYILNYTQGKTGIVIGQNAIDGAYALKNKTGIPILLRFGEGSNGEAQPLYTIKFPIQEPALDITRATYNIPVKRLSIVYAADQPVFADAVTTVLSDSSRIAGAGNENIPLGAGNNTVSFNIDLSNFLSNEKNKPNLTADVKTLFGEEAGSRDYLLEKELPVEVDNYDDLSGIKIDQVRYADRKIIVSAENVGDVGVYFKNHLQLKIYGEPKTLYGDVFFIPRGERKDVVYYIKLDANTLEENKLVFLNDNYGSREGLLLKKIDGWYPLENASYSYTFLLAVVMAILLLIISIELYVIRKHANQDNKKEKKAPTIRKGEPLFSVLFLIFAGLLVISISTPTQAISGINIGKTIGDITFTDRTGSPLSGTITISIAGESQKPQGNVNYVSWDRIPNARIYYDALDTKSLSINLRISGDSPKGRVVLENYGKTLPGIVNITAPGNVVKYVEVNSSGVSFTDADISIKYTDAEVSGLDVNNLVIYHYDSAAQAWSRLDTRIDEANKLLSATVNSLSIFAVASRGIPQAIEVHDAGKIPVISDIKSFDEAKNLKMEAKTSTLPKAYVSERGELEVDAIATKNVAVKFKLKAVSKGEIILDDFGKNNPVSVPLPGRAVKYVEIGVRNISFSSANVTIHYSKSELNGVNENDLKIYHWNGASWDALFTTIDKTNNTLSATATSLSPFGVAGSVTYRFIPSTGVAVATGVTTNFGACGAIPLTYTISLLTNTSPTGCGSSSIYSGTLVFGNLDPAIDMFFNTAYTVNMNVQGNWYNGTFVDDDGRCSITPGSCVVTFRLVYVYPNGTIVALPGTANQTITTGGGIIANYNVSLTNISGIVPAGAKLGLRISQVAFATFIYFGDTAGAGGVPTGYFSITDTPVTYTIAGYVVNASSGLPLSGATVQTNTSLTTTTNASGFYNFTGLSNGTYMINASLAGYVTSTINVTVLPFLGFTAATIFLIPAPTSSWGYAAGNATVYKILSGGKKVYAWSPQQSGNVYAVNSSNRLLIDWQSIAAVGAENLTELDSIYKFYTTDNFSATYTGAPTAIYQVRGHTIKNVLTKNNTGLLWDSAKRLVLVSSYNNGNYSIRIMQAMGNTDLLLDTG